MKYHMLTVENEHAGVNRFNQPLWLCKCDCGATTLALASYVRTGKTKSCGCLKVSGASHRTHGQRSQQAQQGRKTRTYVTWSNMKSRCDNPNTRQWQDYGGRGIKYDPRWKAFQAFYEDMGDPPDPSFTIDRIDNDGPYSKDNCQWSDKSTQRRNKRPESLGGRLVWCEIDGERMILTDAVKKYHVVPYQTAVDRIFKGWSPERAVLTPYTRGFAHAPVTSGVRYTHHGETLTLTEWAKKTGIGRVTLLKRIQRGVPLDKALTVKGFLRMR